MLKNVKILKRLLKKIIEIKKQYNYIYNLVHNYKKLPKLQNVHIILLVMLFNIFEITKKLKNEN